jgi:hypothetical protein
MSQHAATVLIKMDENDQEGVNGADLGLSVSENSFQYLQDNLNRLHTGDKVRFQATFQSLGDSNHLHHLHCFGIVKIEGHMDVEVVVSGGRYKLSEHKHD